MRTDCIFVWDGAGIRHDLLSENNEETSQESGLNSPQ